MEAAQGFEDSVWLWQWVPYSGWEATFPIWVGNFSGIGVNYEEGCEVFRGLMSNPLMAGVVGFRLPISARVGASVAPPMVLGERRIALSDPRGVRSSGFPNHQSPAESATA